VPPDVNGDGELCCKIGKLNHGHEVSRFGIDDKAGSAEGGTDSASAWLRRGGARGAVRRRPDGSCRWLSAEEGAVPRGSVG